MEKKDALRRWENLEPDQPILPHFTPISADARGSTFGACGIRIMGNPEFIDAVLSRLKDLLAAEAGTTRLNLSRQPVKPVVISKGDEKVDKKWGNADTDAETCYIQIRERTAKTRQRKARESTAPLPNIEDDAALSLAALVPAKKDTDKPKTKADRKADKTEPRPDSGFYMIDPMEDEEEE